MSLDIFPSFHLFLQVKKKRKRKKKVSIQLNDRVDRSRRMSCALPSNFFKICIPFCPTLFIIQKKTEGPCRMNRTTRPFKWRHCPPEQEEVPRRSVFLTQFERKWKWKKTPRRAAQMTISFYKIPQHLSSILPQMIVCWGGGGWKEDREMNGERDCIDASRRRPSNTRFPNKKKWKNIHPELVLNFDHPEIERCPITWPMFFFCSFFLLLFNYFLHEIVRRKKNFFELFRG